MVSALAFSTINLLQLILSSFSALLGLYALSIRRLPLAAFLLTMCLQSGIRAFRDSLDFTIVTYSYSLGFLYGPLIYLTLADILKKQQSPGQLLVHFTPFVIVLISLFNNLAALTDFGIALCIYAFIYVFLCYRSLTLFSMALEHTRASDLPTEFFWLRRVLDIFTITVIYQSSRFIAGLVFSDTINTVFELGFFIGSISLFSLLIFQGMRRPSIIPLLDEEDREIARKISKQPRGSISEEQRELSKKLEQLMADQKPFLDPGITVKLLAAQMQISSRKMSELINDVYGYNFSEFVNRARANEAARLIELDINRPFIEIALESGFNAKSSFNLMFKRYLQQTPSQFRTNLLNKDNK